MTAAESRTVIELNCPGWCVGDHEFDDDSAHGGGVTVDHRSVGLKWIATGNAGAAWIVRTDGYAKTHQPASITVSGHFDELNEITADEARQLARVLEQLADRLEEGSASLSEERALS